MEEQREGRVLVRAGTGGRESRPVGLEREQPQRACVSIIYVVRHWMLCVPAVRVRARARASDEGALFDRATSTRV